MILSALIQDEDLLGGIRHLRMQRGSEGVRFLFEMDQETARELDTERPCTVIDQNGGKHRINVVKVFFSGWAFRAHGWLITDPKKLSANGST
jgi:hypothetical protein